MKEILVTEKRDGIPCVIIFPWSYVGLSIYNSSSFKISKKRTPPV